MTNKEILEKAIQKAIEGGWDGGPFRPLHLNLNKWRFDSDYDAFGVGEYEYEIWVEPCEYMFNHEFAKALWGEEKAWYYVEYTDNKAHPHSPTDWLDIDGVGIDVEKWQWKLQQMVVADDPIKYLGENI